MPEKVSLPAPRTKHLSLCLFIYHIFFLFHFVLARILLKLTQLGKNVQSLNSRQRSVCNQATCRRNGSGETRLETLENIV